MTAAPIDVWDASSFDPALTAHLTPAIELVIDYFRTDIAITLAHDLGCGPDRSLMRPDNPYAVAFQAFRHALIGDLEARTIRAWHYTRTTDAKVEVLKRDGPHLSTPATLRRRLDATTVAWSR